MLQYTFKRLLLTIPTFFAITLIIFLVLNIAPGRPGATGGADQGESTTGQEAQESYRIFKEQFNLDKPILLNFRYLTTEQDVRAWLTTAYGLEGEPKAAEKIAAKDSLDDYGNVIVPHLVALLDDTDAEVARQAARHLTMAGKLRFAKGPSAAVVNVVAAIDGGVTYTTEFIFVTSSGYVSFEVEGLSLSRMVRIANEHVRQKNKEIQAYNSAIAEWSYQADADAATIQQVKDQWKTWYGENANKYQLSTGGMAYTTFFDTRFANYWWNLINLDFGVSTVDRTPVLDNVLAKMRYTIILSTLSILIAYFLAIPIGIFSAVRQGTPEDSVVTVLLFIGYSLPTFCTGTVLLQLLSTGDPVAWFPTGNFNSLDYESLTTLEQVGDVAWHLVLPLATYTSVSLAALSRYARTGVIDVIRSDYIRTARAKGLSEFVVIMKHAVRNGMIPVLTLLGGLLPSLIAGSVIIEVIFNIPGMGRLLFDSINLRDYNTVMALLMASSGLALIGILISDLSYAFADPRISFD